MLDTDTSGDPDLRDQLLQSAMVVLNRECALSSVHAVVSGDPSLRSRLWNLGLTLDWPFGGVPVNAGGLGLDDAHVSALAYAFGFHLVPAAFASAIYRFVPILASLPGGHEHLVDAMEKGSIVTVGGLHEAASFRAERNPGATMGPVFGEVPVIDGDLAQVALVLDDAAAAWLVKLDQPEVTRSVLQTIDPSRPTALLHFDGAPATFVGVLPSTALDDAKRRNALLTSFEQLGAADRCLSIGVDHVRQRHAFGRPIGSFQALRHRLVDCYLAIECARSFAEEALFRRGHDRARLSAAAGVSATKALWLVARQTVHTLGALGFTWEADPHLFYRRARHLAASVGGEAGLRVELARELRASEVNP